MRSAEATGLFQAMEDALSGVIVGKREKCRLLLAACLAGGHALLEDVPGTGKTVLARALARLCGCAFARVQCTPDLLPSDVTGGSVFDMKTSEFVFRKGPAFTNVLLADELNRATPRTQAAFLECMEEGRVTEGGETRALPAPFFVVATQNPVEWQGTFPLPEAQLDRFMVCVSLGYPDAREAVRLMRDRVTDDPLAALEPLLDAEKLLAARDCARGVRVSEDVLGYIVALAEHTRAQEGVRLGVSARGTLAMMRCAQAFALIGGREFVTPDDVQALAEPVFAHRLMMSGAYQKAGARSDAVRDALRAVPVPTEAAEV